ncbi:hypothetical protein TRVA0_001S01266 [Trichomonascus vanleenenianus]|uniref:uncharacterized protein n=1 Tax=Trichomonascus vanleenenianus TaxID=2268995 RepID=UPI003ECB90D0
MRKEEPVDIANDQGLPRGALKKSYQADDAILPLTTESMYSTFRKTVDNYCQKNPEKALLDLYVVIIRNVAPKFHDVFQAAYFVALDYPEAKFWDIFWRQLDAFFPRKEHSTLNVIRQIETLKYDKTKKNAAEIFQRARRLAVGLPTVRLHDKWIFETLIGAFPSEVAADAYAHLKLHHYNSTRAEVFDWLEAYILASEDESSSSKLPVCTYCKKPGHTRVNCRRLSLP